MVVNRSADLPDSVARQLFFEITEGIYAKETSLPPEKEIAARMGVSRPVVRESLSRMEREGFVSRKHGVGTVINHHVLALSSRIDMEKDFLDMVRDAGYKPETKDITVSEVEADEESGYLALPKGSPLILVERIITADGEPVIYCRDFFSRELLEDVEYTEEDLKIPVYPLLRQLCNREVHLLLAQVEAASANALYAEKLGIEEGTPVLTMDEVGYDVFDQPLTYSKEVYAGDKIRHSILKKRI